MTPANSKKMVIGITGGTGCGQSTVCHLMEKYGAKVLDADKIAKEATENSPRILSKLQERYGERVFDSWGNLMRRELARIVFTNDEEKLWLNQLIHPEVIAEIEKEKKDFYQFSSHPILVVDAALIYEAGLEKEFDQVVVVTAPLQQRIKRIIKRDKISEAEVSDRIRSQLPIQDKEKRADYVFHNNKGIQELDAKVKEFVHKLGIMKG